MTYQEAEKLLQKYDQTHLLKYYDELTEEERKALLSQIENLDFSVLTVLKKKKEGTEKRGTFSPLQALTIPEIKKKEDAYKKAGITAIREGKTAAVLLAGGQGTRLGFDHPKGMYNVGKTRDLYIFECLIQNLLDVVNEAGAFIPLYIMTSEINHEETVRFFREKNYFGYPKDFIRFFIQDMAPCVGYDEKIMMDSRSHIASSPNGNGGWYHSMVKAGLSDDLKKRGVEYLSCFAVDNVCQRINDPVYTGAFVLSGLDCAGKVVIKADPKERVGVLCLEDGAPSIVEYYEITEEMEQLRNEKGELLYNYGVILNYFFKVDKLQEISDRGMMTHVVEKKIPCLLPDGTFIKPEEPNGYKFELLVLDMIHMMNTCLPYEVLREHEFSPIKNKTGVDSVETAQALLEKNGVKL